MDPEDKANLNRLLAELQVMQARLAAISDASFSDMEGAGMPDFAISECLTAHCEDAAVSLSTCINACKRLSET